MMRCEDLQALVSDYALGEMSVEERRQAREHLRECAVCWAALARTDWLAAVMIETETPTVPAGLRHKVMDAARSRRRSSVAADWNPFKWWGITTAPLHAAAAIMMIIGLAVGLSMGRAMWSGPNRSVASGETTASLDMLRIDTLGAAPDDSLAGAYTVLAAGQYQEGR
ncbi:MAG: anti-sigma factor family protein [Candidatus Sumerlaeota bacterium]